MFTSAGGIFVLSSGAMFEILFAPEQSVGAPPRSVFPHTTLYKHFQQGSMEACAIMHGIFRESYANANITKAMVFLLHEGDLPLHRLIS